MVKSFKDLDEDLLMEIAGISSTIKQLAGKLENNAQLIVDGGVIDSPSDDFGDMQKLIVSIIRGGEIMFKDLTGVKY